MRFNIKPLSANLMTYRNKAIKQKCYIEYQNELRDCIGRDTPWPFGQDPVRFKIIAAFSSRGADLDNILKPLFDTYQGIFPEFNDNKVYMITAEKKIVSKGNEYLDVDVERYDIDG